MKIENENQQLLKLSKPTQGALANAGITRIEQLSTWKEADFTKLHGTGKMGLQILKTLMADSEIEFRHE